jgi:hypothetical protein
MKAKNLAKMADKAELARLETWAGDFAKDRFTTQVAKREHVLQMKAGEERAENVGHRLDQVAAVGASATAWVVPHLMPHGEHHAPHGLHEAYPGELEPVSPWSGR